MLDELVKLKKENRMTRTMAIALDSLLLMLWLSGFIWEGKKERFAEIDVERINIVEKDGRLRMVIASRERQHPGSIDGQLMPRKNGRPPSLIFFNHLGDECGGIVFDENGGKGHFLSLTFDKSKNDQTVGLQHLESDNGQYFAGLRISDRPDTTRLHLLAELEMIKAMREGKEKTQALKELRENGDLGAGRITVGRLRDRSAVVELSDTESRARLRMKVDSVGVGRIEFLDEDGKATLSIPE